MKKNIFISSTYIDLQHHRKKIWQLLKNYDVNVLGMEQFGARKGTPLDTCIQEVSKSDIYIGIISHRLGSIEPSSKKSYTQLEYEEAVKQDKEILIYLIDEENSTVKIEFIDFGEKHEQLKNFKQLLKDKHTVDFFSNEADLSEKLNNRLKTILVPTNIETEVEEQENARNILEKFYLFPRKYSEREISIKIKILTNAFPLSKKACEVLGYSFGDTIVVPIEIVSPDIGNQINCLIVKEDLSDFYFTMSPKQQELDVLARLIFSDKRIGNLKANLFDKKQKQKKINPYYDPNKPSLESVFNMNASMEEMLNKKYVVEDVLVEGEGTVILSLIKVIK